MNKYAPKQKRVLGKAITTTSGSVPSTELFGDAKLLINTNLASMSTNVLNKEGKQVRYFCIL